MGKSLIEVIREKYGLLVEGYTIQPETWYEKDKTQIKFRFIKTTSSDVHYIELSMTIPYEEIENPLSIIERLDKIFVKRGE